MIDLKDINNNDTNTNEKAFLQTWKGFFYYTKKLLMARVNICFKKFTFVNKPSWGVINIFISKLTL